MDEGSCPWLSLAYLGILGPNSKRRVRLPYCNAMAQRTFLARLPPFLQHGKAGEGESPYRYEYM